MNLILDDANHALGDGGIIGLSWVTDLYDRQDLFEIIDNERVVRLSGLRGEGGFRSVETVRKSTGISVRRMLQPGVTAVDLAELLWRKLQDGYDCATSGFDEVLFCHSSTNPSECRNVARALFKRIPDLRQVLRPLNYGCCGYLKMLDEAVQSLDSNPDMNRIAILSVETPETWHDASDRLFCGIVSAGATATVVERDRGVPIAIARSEDFRVPLDSRPNPDPLFIRDNCVAFSFRGTPVNRTVMRMNAESVFLNGIELMLDNLRSALVSIDRKPGQRVVVVPHQPSGKLLRALVATARADFPELEFVNNLDQYGNTISSSVPTIVSRLPEVLKANRLAPLNDGDHLILLAAGICMKEIDDHMSSGHTCMTWQTGALNTVVPQTQVSSVSWQRAGYLKQ
jgi:3-oxoacyl-[acyl-carrier-protein] synthase III